MKVAHLHIKNFRGIKTANLNFSESQVFLGDNNTGKTTVLEALDLALGPDRVSRFPPVNEHDFFQGKYLPQGEEVPIGQQIVDSDFSNCGKIFTDENTNTIAVLVKLVDLDNEQKSAFGGRCEFYSNVANKFLDTGEIGLVDEVNVVTCLRIIFLGHYDSETDDFIGRTYYFKDLFSDKADEVRKKQKQLIGFLLLRSLRTGSRALSLERGSLLDIVLRTREVKPKMWEDVLSRLDNAKIPIDDKDEIGVVLSDVQTAINRYVPKEWGSAPKLKVSRMTREDLRRTIVAFIETSGDHSAPYFRQGTGTSNMLVLALLSIIRDKKQNVIFAMEEPETAIPPNVQKQVVSEVVANSNQAIFTSHSPYVIEEFELNQLAILESESGIVAQHMVSIPDPSTYNYHQYFRSQLCEGLLSRRLIICEGATEVSIIAGLSRHLAKLNESKYADLCALGYCLINSQTDSQILNHANALSGLGKHISVFCDAQNLIEETNIRAVSHEAFIHPYQRVEDLLIDNVAITAKTRFANNFTWPQFVLDTVPNPVADVDEALKRYLKKTKGTGGAMIFLSQCYENELPQFLQDMIEKLTVLARPKPEEGTGD